MYRTNNINCLNIMSAVTFSLVSLSLVFGLVLRTAQADTEFPETAETQMHITGSWVRPARAGAESVTAYMTIHNDIDQPLVLESIESVDFESVMVHEIGEVDGMLAMKAVENLEIPANGAVALKPGGKHLMLMEPLRKVGRGDSLELVFRFVSGYSQVIELNIEE